MSQYSLRLKISDQYLSSYYKVFGHFFLDHIFQLYKIKRYLENERQCTITKLLIEKKSKLYEQAPFAHDFYSALFPQVNQTFLPWQGDFHIGEVLGSANNSEENPVYLDLSDFKRPFPSEVIANGRRLSSFNQVAAKQLRSIFLKHFQVTDQQEKNSVLIVNRKKSPRKLRNLDKLTALLASLNFKSETVVLDDLTLSEQIVLVHKYPVVISACGSAQVQVAFMREGSKFIELNETGFRYPNTAIYGNRYGIETFTLCSPLEEKLQNIRNSTESARVLFAEGDAMPLIIRNSEEEIHREIDWYAKLLSPECIHCYEIHRVQDIDCLKYLDQIKTILQA